MFLERSKKKIFIGLIISAALIVSAVIFKEMNVESAKLLLTPVVENNVSFESKSSKTGVALMQSSPEIITPPVKEYTTLFGNPVQAAEVADWFASRGSYDFSDKNLTYKSYDKLTLEQLAAEGNMRAMHALADFYLDPENIEYGGFDPAIEQFWNAAIYGSTGALANLAHIHKIKVYETINSIDGKKSAAIEFLALYKTASLRGDRWSELSDVPTFLKMANIHLPPDDQDKIEARAKEIYNDLESKRNAKGLGNFDNSMPDSVKNLFDKIEKIDAMSAK